MCCIAAKIAYLTTKPGQSLPKYLHKLYQNPDQYRHGMAYETIEQAQTTIHQILRANT